MSDAWYTRIYFRRQAECSYDFLLGITEALARSGLKLSDRSAQLEAALERIVEHRGGCIEMLDLEDAISGLVCLYPSGGGGIMAPAEAEAEYGHVGLIFDYAYLWGKPIDVVCRRYGLLFRWSTVLAQSTPAIYGWGDLGRSFEIESGVAVLAADLARWVIPRLSWWNFFSKEYVEHIGRDRLYTAGAWLQFEDDRGLTIILHPPGEPEYASRREELTKLGLRG